MADEFNTSTNWWESSSTRTRFDTTRGSSSSSSLGGNFTWPPSSSSMESSVQVSTDSSSLVFHDTQKLQQPHQDPNSGATDLQMMGLGLSSQPIDWNQALLRGGGDKPEAGFRSMLQDNLSSSSRYQQEPGIESSQLQWNATHDQRLFTRISGDTSMNQEQFKQIKQQGFSLDHHQPQFTSHGSSCDLYGSPSAMLLGTDHNQGQHYQYGSNYGFSCSSSNESLTNSNWSKVPAQFLRNSPPKPQQPPQTHLHFSNNAPFWNASASSVNDIRPGFFPLQPQFLSSSFDEKPQNKSDQVREPSTVVKKIGSDSATKRPRSESQTPLPAFKVRKEKMGDRITALQQLVSPFGKTDTASVLTEVIDYIKFLHDQVSMLSTPYMKSGPPRHHQQGSDKSKEHEGQKQDLKSRGLCLVPVSSTFPVTHETTVDFWTPTFGGTFR